MRTAEKLLAGHSRGRSCVCHQLDQGREVANALGEEKISYGLNFRCNLTVDVPGLRGLVWVPAFSAAALGVVSALGEGGGVGRGSGVQSSRLAPMSPAGRSQARWAQALQGVLEPAPASGWGRVLSKAFSQALGQGASWLGGG